MNEYIHLVYFLGEHQWWSNCWCNTSSDVGKRGHFSDGISLQYGNDFEGNDTCNDWMEKFCTYNTDDQLDESVCHLSEMDE